VKSSLDSLDLSWNFHPHKGLKDLQAQSASREFFFKQWDFLQFLLPLTLILAKKRDECHRLHLNNVFLELVREKD